MQKCPGRAAAGKATADQRPRVRGASRFKESLLQFQHSPAGQGGGVVIEEDDAAGLGEIRHRVHHYGISGKLQTHRWAYYGQATVAAWASGQQPASG